MKNISNLITGTIAVSMAMVFLLHFAIRLHDVTLWIIILANLAALLYDFYKSIIEGEENI